MENNQPSDEFIARGKCRDLTVLSTPASDLSNPAVEQNNFKQGKFFFFINSCIYSFVCLHTLYTIHFHLLLRYTYVAVCNLRAMKQALRCQT